VEVAGMKWPEAEMRDWPQQHGDAAGGERDERSLACGAVACGRMKMMEKRRVVALGQMKGARVLK
jgi:hypothetical protein